MDFWDKYGPDLFKVGLDILKGHLPDLKVENRFLRFSAFLYIVILGIWLYFFPPHVKEWCEKILLFLETRGILAGDSVIQKLPDTVPEIFWDWLQDVLYVSVTALIARIGSVGLVKGVIKKKLDGLLQFGSAYEEREGHFYLKPEYEGQRKIPSWVSEKIGRIWVITLAGYVWFSRQEWIPQSMELLDNFLVYLLTCVGLLGEYINGKTYEEMQQCFIPEEPKKRTLYELAEETMRRSIKQFRLLSFPIQYGIRYPQKTYTENYRTFFQALQAGQSIFVEDIFYRDWERAFFIPANRVLLEYRKIVVLAGPSLEAQDIAAWLKSGFSSLNGCDEAWKVMIWDGSGERSDVIVVPFEKIPEYVSESRAIHKKDRGLFCVVMEPSAMMAQLQFYLEQYVEVLSEMEEAPFYCFADRYMIGLRDYLAHVFRCRIEHIEINTDRSRRIYLYISETGENEEVRDYWGALLGGSGCGSVYFYELLKRDFGAIEYVSQSTAPVKDLCCLIKDKMAVTFSSQEEQLRLEKSFHRARFLKGIWGIGQEEDKYMIVTDEICHLYDLIWALSARGSRDSHLFILSGEYLLFDYMVQNISRLLKVRNAVPVLFPVYQDSERNRFLRIFRSWKLYGAFDVGELEEICPEAANQEKEELCLALNRKVRALFHDRPFQVNDGEIVMCSAFFDHRSELWKEVVYVDELSGQNSFGCLFECQLTQRWRRGQYLVKDGCYYQIREIRDGERTDSRGVSRECKEVRLLKSSGFMQHTGLYYQDRRYRLRILEQIRAQDREDSFQLYRCRANIAVITGDWFLERFDERGSRNERRIHDIVPVRRYWNKELLLICLPGEDIRFWRHMKELLSRMVRTIYPTYYPYIDFLPAAADAADRENAGLYVIEDCVDDLGLLESFEKNWDRIIGLCRDFCSRT